MHADNTGHVEEDSPIWTLIMRVGLKSYEICKIRRLNLLSVRDSCRIYPWRRNVSLPFRASRSRGCYHQYTPSQLDKYEYKDRDVYFHTIPSPHSRLSFAGSSDQRRLDWPRSVDGFPSPDYGRHRTAESR